MAHEIQFDNLSRATEFDKRARAPPHAPPTTTGLRAASPGALAGAGGGESGLCGSPPLPRIFTRSAVLGASPTDTALEKKPARSVLEGLRDELRDGLGEVCIELEADVRGDDSELRPESEKRRGRGERSSCPERSTLEALGDELGER